MSLNWLPVSYKLNNSLIHLNNFGKRRGRCRLSRRPESHATENIQLFFFFCIFVEHENIFSIYSASRCLSFDCHRLLVEINEIFPVGNRCNKDGITRYISSIIHHFSSSDDCNFVLYVVASVRWLRQPPNNSKNVPKLTHQLTICTWPYPATQEQNSMKINFLEKKKLSR